VLGVSCKSRLGANLAVVKLAVPGVRLSLNCGAKVEVVRVAVPGISANKTETVGANAVRDRLALAGVSD
jgi:hypothetical protein